MNELFDDIFLVMNEFVTFIFIFGPISYQRALNETFDQKF